jgi:hypothetical protein
MAFMTPEYTQETFVTVTNKYGESYSCPMGYEEIEEGDTVETIEGKWWCHLSASGYMDQTEWDGPFDTEEEAREHITDTFECDPDTGDELEEEDV